MQRRRLARATRSNAPSRPMALQHLSGQCLLDSGEFPNRANTDTEMEMDGAYTCNSGAI
eukprot:m.1647531 g.1647531  ORF g.1647531 m.1647531 type:complete len:59 (-) comp75205_c0_seq1:45-221(-)